MMPEILQPAAEGKADPYYIVALYATRGEKDAASLGSEKALQSSGEIQTNGNDSRTTV
jgi:hypothetical protein